MAILQGEATVGTVELELDAMAMTTTTPIYARGKHTARPGK
jgi:hypothetical protein